jgi:RimJ/RimL family protein N-acetyltransferase
MVGVSIGALMDLIDVYTNVDEHFSILDQLLAEREEYESISHNDMPTWGEHYNFVKKRPYKVWYIIYDEQTPVGSVYLSFSNEIGIAIFKKHRRKGYASDAIMKLVAITKEKFYLANINPNNQKSIDLFTKKLGLKHIQNTYKIEMKGSEDDGA